MPDCEIMPPFDDDLNRRLNAGTDPETPRSPSIGQLLEEARAEEREACAQIADSLSTRRGYAVTEEYRRAARFIAKDIRRRGEG